MLTQYLHSRKYWEFVIVFAILCVPLFLYIDTPVIVLWDESRNAVNALEMLANKEYFVRHFNGAPDMWEVKPPLLIWLQLLSFKVFGINEFAIRFPSILATLSLAVTIIITLKKKFSLPYVGYMAALVLISTQGYIDRHIARTGDHDALLVFFACSSLLHFYLYIVHNQKVRNLIFGFIFLLCATYTKSIVSFMYIPGIVLFVVYMRKILPIIKDYRFYIACAVYIVCVAFYYWYRNSINPGYVETVWNEELFPRYANTQSGIEYYIKNFFNSRFVPWIYVLCIAIPISLYKATKEQRDFLILLITTAGIFLFVIGNGSKNLWYDALLYPLFSIIIAFGIQRLYEVTEQWISQRIRIIICASIFISIFGYSYGSIIQRLHHDSKVYIHSQDIYSISYYLREKIEQKQFDTPYIIAYKGYNAHILFYTTLYQRSGGSITIKKNAESLAPGSHVIASQPAMIEYIEQNYEYTIIAKRYMAKVYTIHSPKVVSTP
ncbi:MAG: Undecaprenyl phosphate-alpha-4-amino-4-deoxy-L-arabinose arabinosyl transferase [Bacteroidetes bacterium ADurb.Bin217]|nr:MAG: Undecaprenyl phosphate-alpha-4-amino-4-deoxy-L-arabinose arabinosyl transferase [Bacteroidetes bacterium ADurb.Bin217]